MKTLLALIAVAIHLGTVTSVAIPSSADVKLISRQNTGTEQDPIEVEIKCKGVEKICEAHSTAILCFNAPYRALVEDAFPKDSGRRANLFRVGSTRARSKSLLVYGLDLEESVVEKLGKEWSDTEFVRKESDGIQIPVNRDENREYLDNILKPALEEAAKARNEDMNSLKKKWFILKFTELGSNTPRTSALMASYDRLLKSSTPQGASLFSKEQCLTDDKFDPVNNAYMHTEKPVESTRKPVEHNMNTPIGMKLGPNPRPLNYGKRYFHHMKPGRDVVESKDQKWPVEETTGKDKDFDPEIEKKQKEANILVGKEVETIKYKNYGSYNHL